MPRKPENPDAPRRRKAERPEKPQKTERAKPALRPKAKTPAPPPPPPEPEPEGPQYVLGQTSRERRQEEARKAPRRRTYAEGESIADYDSVRDWAVSAWHEEQLAQVESERKDRRRALCVALETYLGMSYAPDNPDIQDAPGTALLEVDEGVLLGVAFPPIGSAQRLLGQDVLVLYGTCHRCGHWGPSTPITGRSSLGRLLEAYQPASHDCQGSTPMGD